MFNVAEMMMRALEHVRAPVSEQKKQRLHGFPGCFLVVDKNGHGRWVNPSRKYPYSSKRQNERNHRHYGGLT